jgi:hypothetical protein
MSHGADYERSYSLLGGSVCESNAPATGNLPPAGFEVEAPSGREAERERAPGARCRNPESARELYFGGSVCESNAPATSKMPPAGFEDREDHRTLCASGL